VDRAKLSVCLVYFVTILICTPNFVTITVKSYDVTSDYRPTSAYSPPDVSSVQTSSFPDVSFTEVTVASNANSTTVSLATDEPILVWNVDFKVNSGFDRFVQSLNFWIQVKHHPAVFNIIGIS
jgi:hypothetical protein